MNSYLSVMVKCDHLPFFKSDPCSLLRNARLLKIMLIDSPTSDYNVEDYILFCETCALLFSFQDTVAPYSMLLQSADLQSLTILAMHTISAV